jgi:opacity protein-like surface antigen
MNKIPRSLLLCLAALAFSASGRAEGVYLRAQAMFNRPNDVETSSLTAFRTSLKSNVAYAGAIGYKFPLLRVEGELQRFQQDAAQGSGTTGTTTASGGYRQLNGFANAFVDLDLAAGLGVYLGGGLGFARVNFDNLSGQQGGITVAQYSGKDRAFAHQVAGGVQLSFAGRATLHAGYRIVKQGDVQVRDSVTTAIQTVKLGDNRLFEIGLAIGF